jgi:gliding motility-associated-like protein
MNYRKHVAIMLLMLVCITKSFSQVNLVPNPSFEELNNNLNTSLGIWDDTTQFLYVRNWFGPKNGVGGYLFNEYATVLEAKIPKNSFGFQYAHIAKGYAGLMPYSNSYSNSIIPYFSTPYRIYLANKLEDKLVKNNIYKIQYYVSPASFIDSIDNTSSQSFSITRKNINIYISDTALIAPRIDTFWNFALLIPNILPSIKLDTLEFMNDTTKWYKISGFYKSIGGEKYLTIGNFYNDNNTSINLINSIYNLNPIFPNKDSNSIYYIDDVGIFDVTHFIQADSFKCINTKSTLTTTLEFDKYLWNTGDTTRTISSNQLGTFWCQVTEGCNTHTDTFVIQQMPIPLPFSLGNDTTICTNKTLQLTAPPNYTYLWSTGEQTQQINISQAGTYVCNISNACGVVKDTIIIAALQAPNTNPLIQGNTELCQNGVMVTSNLFTSSTHNLLWSTGNQASNITIKLPGTYTLKEYNTCGEHEEQVYVSGCSGIIDFPNAFSPNADGVNDEFKPIIQDGRKVSKYNFIIYNRWGKQVFKTNNVQQGWDGKHAELGTYFYYCSFTENNKPQTYKGDVSLVK